nr:mucin-7-like [Aegilops tauschii subsp. strangulata]
MCPTAATDDRPARMDSPAPSLTPPATGAGFSPQEITHAPPPAPKKSLGMKKPIASKPPPTAPMAFGVATASPATELRPRAASTGDKPARKSTAAVLAEAAAKKMMKKAKAAPRFGPTPRAATPVAPTSTAPARAAAAAGNKHHGCQVLY